MPKKNGQGPDERDLAREELARQQEAYEDEKNSAAAATEDNFSYDMDDDVENSEEEKEEQEENNRRRDEKEKEEEEEDEAEEDEADEEDKENEEKEKEDEEEEKKEDKQDDEDEGKEDEDDALDDQADDAETQDELENDLEKAKDDANSSESTPENTEDLTPSREAPEEQHNGDESQDQKSDDSGENENSNNEGEESSNGKNGEDGGEGEGEGEGSSGNTGSSGGESGAESESAITESQAAQAETAAEAETTAGAGEGVAAAEGGGAAAGGSAAAAEGGAAAAGGSAGAAGGAAAAGGAIYVLGIVLIVLIIIIVVIGLIGFFTLMPTMLWNRIKEFALSLWDGFQGYIIGQDEAGVNKSDIIEAAQYLYDMGYDLVGMGFAESVEIAGQKDENGNVVPITEDYPENAIVDIDAPYIRAYLVAENRTYLVTNFTYNVTNMANSIFDGSFFSANPLRGSTQLTSTWGTGLINLEPSFWESFPVLGPLITSAQGVTIGPANVGEFIKGVKVERSSNTMRVRRLNMELAVWKSHFDYTYYSLEGWTGRYGKPFELMITLHVATMAPDLVKEFALNEDLDAKVNIKFRNATFGGKVYVDGVAYDDMDDDAYSEDTMKWLKKLQKDKASEIKTGIPYISSVTKHWFRNVYFEGTNSQNEKWKKVGSVDIGIDNDSDGLEDYNETTGVKTQVTKKLSSSDSSYDFGTDTKETMVYQGDDIPTELEGCEITLVGTIDNGMTQIKDGVRGVTNPTTKKLFNEEYYIYDGTVTTAKEIQEARAKGDKSRKQKINLTKNSLQAFSILEGSETLDSQFIYRDLKELVIEIGYFNKDDFYEVEKQVLEWPVPEYRPAEWPNTDLEKQTLEYGAMIASDDTVAASLGMTVEDLQKFTNTPDEEPGEEEEIDELKALKGMVFIGDEFVEGIKNSVTIEKAKYFSASGSGPQYWLDNIAKLPDTINKVVICTGVNEPREYESLKGLIDALREKYEGIKIYVVEVMHVSSGCTDADAINKQIDTFNTHVREKCQRTEEAKLLDASLTFVHNGYLYDADSTGRHLASSAQYQQYVKNIAMKIKESNNKGRNATDEVFVYNVLKASKEILGCLKDKEYQFGTPSYIPPRKDGAINEYNGATDDDGGRNISGAGFVSWALYDAGYRDLPECGLSLGDDGDFIEYCESKDWEKVNSEDSLQAGDIVFTGKLDEDGKKARNVYICAGKDIYYECNSQDKLTAEQPVKETLSDFVCAYRVTGNGIINSGLKAGLNVIAPYNGKVTDVLSEGNNIYSLNYLSNTLTGKDAREDEYGLEQAQSGLRIKLTDHALRGYVLIMYGFDVQGITAGSEIKVGEVIGKSLDSNIYLILLDRDKGVVDDLENYFKVPKKEKEIAAITDWELFYWLPFESGAADTTNSYRLGRYTGPACVSTCSEGEVAIGIVQWTSLGNMCNQRDQFLPFMKENYPQFYAKLSFLEGKGADYYWSDYNGANAVQAALLACDKMDHELFLQAQFECAKENYYEPMIKEHPWLENRPACVQGEILHLKLWGASLSDLDSHQGESDKAILAYVRHKIANTSSTAGPASGDETKGRAFSEPEIGYGILDGKLSETEIEEWVRTGDVSVLRANGIKYNGP